MIFRKRPLGELVELHDNRRVPLSGVERAARNGEFPYYGAQGIIDWIDDYRYEGRFLLVPEDGENLRSRKSPIALAVEGQFWVNNHAHVLRANPLVADQHFLKHAIEAADISSRVTGAAQPKLSQENLRLIEVPSPSVKLQLRIGDVLDSFDTLIESNRRRISVLEEMARKLYQEWFVHYRFPGYEAVGSADSPIGGIPDTWSLVAFSELAEFVNGFAFRPLHLQDSGAPIIKIKELKNGITTSTPRYPGDDLKEKYRVLPGDLLFSWSGDLEAYLWGGPGGWLNQHLFRVDEFDGTPRSWLYLALRDRMCEFRRRSQGTTMKHIQRSAMDQVRVVRPDSKVLSMFDAQAAPIQALSIALQQTTASVVAARDLLLPKLVTGQIEVDSLGVDDVFGWAERAEATVG